MSPTINRRLASLEARVLKPPQQTFMVMPWDILPETGPDDLILKLQFVQPTGEFGGECVPYERTGIHPEHDLPGSLAVLYRATGNIRTHHNIEVSGENC